MCHHLLTLALLLLDFYCVHIFAVRNNAMVVCLSDKCLFAKVIIFKGKFLRGKGWIEEHEHILKLLGVP